MNSRGWSTIRFAGLTDNRNFHHGICSRTMSSYKIHAQVWAVVAIVCGTCLAADTGVSDQALEKIYRDMIAAADRLDALGKQFDADHNQQLSPAEQEAMLAHVKEKFGADWANRLSRFLQAADANHDGKIDLAEWTPAVARVTNLAKKPAGAVKAQTERVPMRDGTRLATDIFLPAGQGPFPVILSRTPYNRVTRAEAAAGFLAQGWVFVSQDMRGRFGSEGENLPFVGCGWGEHQDGVDTVAWLRQQKWCNGKIATIGGSAGGITQNLLAGAAPQGLTAQYLTVAAASLYSDASYIGGAFRKADVESWLTGNKFDAKALQLMREHPHYDAYWRQYDTATKFSVMNVPAVHVGGWFDMFAQATIDEFVGRQHAGATGSRGTQKLVMGPWTHGIGQMPAGELNFPKANKVPDQYSAGHWFEHYLNGVPNGVDKESAVAYYVLGDTSVPGAPGNEWRFADDWPVPAKLTPYFFAPGDKLTSAKPTAQDVKPVEFVFDPANPCPTVGGNNLTIARGPHNQNKIEKRGDVISFTTAPLAEPLEVTGRVKAQVFVASSAVDTDLSVRLCDVYPDGKSYLLAEGMLRLRFRNSVEKPELLTPNKVEAVTVDCWSTSVIFNRGHRIRVSVTSSNYPRFDINPGTGQAVQDGGATVKQTNRIFCDSEHPSSIQLPVVAGN